jgi:carbamoyl-phosphate synthase small subunit
MKNCFLILEDGSVYAGKSFGYPPVGIRELKELPEGSALRKDNIKLPVGEVVFNTGMSGYHEILTDPSYSGQIIVMTYPHIGNYGTHDSWSEYGPDKDAPSEFARLKACGLAVHSLHDGPIPFGRMSLDVFMRRYKTTGITGIDTRRLTLKIREGGSPRGIIVKSGSSENLSKEELNIILKYLYDFPVMEGRNLVEELGSKQILYMNKDGRPHISLIDCGVKANIIRELIALGCRVTVVPNAITPAELLNLKQDGILFSNGPGDPAVLPGITKLAGEVMGKRPVFGICLGHQIISLAMGAKTFKMKFGHHGVNNPVRDETTTMVQVTSQNHGFAVAEETLPTDCFVRFRNANDHTVEGIENKKLRILTAQFHPEAAPGPRDSLWIFSSFLELI